MKSFQHLFALLLAMLALLTGGARSQNTTIPGGVFTAATTTIDATGTPWAYLKISSPEPATLNGKSVAVYVKNGGQASTATFTLRGAMMPALDKAVAKVCLDRSKNLGISTTETEAATRMLYRSAQFPNYLEQLANPQPGGPPRPDAPPQPGEPPAAEQLAMVMNRAQIDPATKEQTELLGYALPAFAMAEGTGWAERLTVSVGSQVTIELRLREGGVDGIVIGRVVLVAGAPVPLPAPGAPVQVPDFKPTGDLNIQLRWATPDDLRQQTLLTHGSSLFRMTADFANTHGYISNPPTTAALLAAVAANPTAVKRVNSGLLLQPKRFRLDNVANFDATANGDPTTSFYIDDNDRPIPQAGQDPELGAFVDGEDFYYCVAAKDLLGREGIASPVGRGRAFRTIAPAVPSQLRANVETTSVNVATGNPTAIIHLDWEQSIAKRTPVSRYEILRGSDLTTLQTNDHDILELIQANLGSWLELDNPNLLIPCASVPASNVVDGRLKWSDPQTFLAPGQTGWYAVRAVFDGARGPVYSSTTAPAFVSLRSVNAPAPPQLCTQGTNAPFAVVAFTGELGEPGGINPKAGYRVKATCTRENSGVTYARFFFQPNGSSQNGVERTVYFPATGGNEVSTLFEHSVLDVIPEKESITCVVGTQAGVESKPVFASFVFPDKYSGATTIMQFKGGAYSLTDLPPAGPLLTQVTGSGTTTGNVTTVQNGITMGTVASTLNNKPVIILQNGAVLGGALVSATGSFMLPKEFGGSFQVRPLNINTPNKCIHQRDSAAGQTQPLQLGLCVPSDAKEYRVYRQIDGGEPQLVSQGMCGVNSQLAVSDTSLPPISTTVTYYGQFVNGAGNASPLAVLNSCPLKIIAALPTPNLQPPVAKIGPSQQAQIELHWFCPPPGVERFQVFLQSTKNSLVSSYFIELPAALAGAVPTRLVTQQSQGLQASSPSPLGISFTPVISPTYEIHNLVPIDSLKPFLSNTKVDSYYTSRINSAELGAGPSFTLSADIAKGTKYRIWVKAIGPTGGVGPPSAVRDFTWTVPPVPRAPTEPKVDWPHRPLPGAVSGLSTEFDNQVLVNSTSFPAYQNAVNPRVDALIWPDNSTSRYVRGVKIGRVRRIYVKHYSMEQMRADIPLPIVILNGIDELIGKYNPNEHVTKKSGVSLLPAMLYRRQIPSARYPEVTGDLIQVSPLIEQIAWKQNGTTGRIVDPFIGVVRTSATLSGNPAPSPVAPAAASGSGVTTYSTGIDYGDDLTFYLLDTQPVMRAASYQYILVRFHPKTGEILESIDAGTTTLN